VVFQQDRCQEPELPPHHIITGVNYRISISLDPGYYLTAAFILPNREAKIVYPNPQYPDNPLSGNFPITVECELPLLSGDGAFDVFQTRKPIFTPNSVCDVYRVFQMINRISASINSLKNHEWACSRIPITYLVS